MLYSGYMAFANEIHERLTALLETSGRELQFASEKGFTEQAQMVRAFHDAVTPMLMEYARLIGELATEIDALRAEIERKG